MTRWLFSSCDSTPGRTKREADGLPLPFGGDKSVDPGRKEEQLAPAPPVTRSLSVAINGCIARGGVTTWVPLCVGKRASGRAVWVAIQ